MTHSPDHLPDHLRVPAEPRDCWFRGPYCETTGLEYILGNSLFVVCRGCLPRQPHQGALLD